jgi:hypothetical protein
MSPLPLDGVPLSLLLLRVSDVAVLAHAEPCRKLVRDGLMSQTTPVEPEQ